MGGDLHIKNMKGGVRLEHIQVEVTREHLQKFGNCFIKLLAKEAKVDFAKRGWSGHAYDGTADLWDSFSFRIGGERTIEILSTFPRIEMLTGEGLPKHPMTWLTQEAKDKHPTDYELTKQEKAARMRKTGRVSRGTRLPLVVPIQSGGTVIFRAAPLKLQDAWVHPGIARFTFVQRALRKANKVCAEIFGQAALDAIVKISNGKR